MNLIYIAMLALGAFVAIWMFFVVPAERKHHERKMEALRKKIEKREASSQENRKYAVADTGTSSIANDPAGQE